MTRPDTRALPAEQPTRTNSRRIAALLLGALVLVVGANEAARRVLRASTPNIGYALVPQKWELLLQRERPVDWLVLGDSSCNQGLDPAVLGRALGGEALNLCTVASSLAVDAAWMLDWHLRRLGPPGAVLAIHAHHIWHRELEPFAPAHVPLEWGFWRKLEPRLEPDAGWTLQAFVARYLPLYAENRSLGRLLMRPWEARTPYRVDARGFMAVERGTTRAVEKDARRRLGWLGEQQRARLSPRNRGALRQLGVLADRHGFDVYLLPAPVYRGIAEDPAFRRHQSDLARLLRQLSSRHERLHYLEREHTFSIEEMQNGDHLLAAAAARYTHSVAADVAARRVPQLARRPTER
jgi:hypothetical protein